MGRSFWISTSAIALLWGGVAHAQSAQVTATPPRDAQATTLGEVIVTAERRSRNLQETPIAATVLTGEQLASRGVTTIEQLQFVTPSLTVQNSGQGNSFNIRGIGKTENNSSVGVGVITYRDGVATFPAYFQNEPLYDIAGVEVLRGPQGTFAGQNATGGAVFITQRRPDFAGVHGYIQGQYGNYDNRRLQGAINQPLSDTVAVRLAANLQQRDSFFDVIEGQPTRGQPGEVETQSFRGAILWRPTDAFSATFSTDYNLIDLGGYPTSPVGSSDDLFDIRTNGPFLAQDETVRSVLNLSYAFDNGVTLRSITGYQNGTTAVASDADGTAAPTPFGSAQFYAKADQRIWSQELNLVSPDASRLRWVVGAYYQHDLITFPPGQFITTQPLSAAMPVMIDITLEGRNPKTTAAAFGQVSYDLTPSLELQVGARYSHSTVVNEAVSAIPQLGLSLSQDEKQDGDAVTGKVALNWTLDDDNFLYGFVARGHKAGGINGVNTSFVPPSAFEAEEVTDFELGWKADWFGGQLRTQLGGYYNLYENFQVSLGDPLVAALAEVRNVPGTTKIYGLEATAQGRFERLGFDVGLTLAKSELAESFLVDSRLPRAAACDPDAGPASANCINVGGNPQTYSPEVTFNLGVEYDFNIAGGRLTPRIDYSHISEAWVSIFQNEALGDRLEARNIVNAQLTYDAGNWVLQAYSTNLTDEHYVGSVKSGQRYAAPPRQYGVRLTRHF